MSIGSKLSGHWTDEQMIDHLYGIGPEDNHLAGCEECTGRLSVMVANRSAVEETVSAGDGLTSDFLAAQRRKIYARIDQRSKWSSGRSIWRWASAAAAITVVGGGLAVLDQTHSLDLVRHVDQKAQVSSRISDTQLADEVSLLADSPEPQPTAPLQALFSE